jgi:hypothetical protein
MGQELPKKVAKATGGTGGTGGIGRDWPAPVASGND